MTAAERVARGAVLLDEKRPGWPYQIDLSMLELWDSCRCVLGQLWDDEDAVLPAYWDGLDALGISDAPAQFGFTILAPGRDDEDAAWAELDELWIAEIRRRTAVPA